MNIPQRQLEEDTVEFSIGVNALLSFNLLQEKIQFCDSLLASSDLTKEKKISITKCKMNLGRLFNFMKSLDGDYTEDAISYMNYTYNDISTAIDIIAEQYEIVREVPQSRLSYTPQNVPTIDNIYELPGSNNPDVQVYVQEQKKRIKAIQREVFGKDNQILPETTIAKKREEIVKVLSDAPELQQLYMTDIQAANDEKFPDTELSDTMILSALKTAKIRKDGAFVQSIKNNLIKNAKLISGAEKNKESSLLLADHIKNVSITRPIRLNTVEYGTLNIVSIQSVDYGDNVYYNARTIFPNGEIKSLMLSANACTVGDLSDKIMGEIDLSGKIILANKPCTIRHIQSTIPNKKEPSFLNKTRNILKNIFRF